MATNDYSNPQQQQLHDNGQQTHEHEDIKVCYSAPNTPPEQLTDGQISEGKVVFRLQSFSLYLANRPHR